MDNDINREAAALLEEFLTIDDLQRLAADAGALLGCPLLVIDDAYHVCAHYLPLGFSDKLFQDAIRIGEITYEAGAIISQSSALTAGKADYIELDESQFRRRFAPLVSAGVRLGYLVCVDIDRHLDSVPDETWKLVESILAKQLFVEASRQDKPFETAEDILMHLLDGGFTSAAYYKLQTANTYLANFRPSAFALIELIGGNHPGKSHLRDELVERFPDSHPFLYQTSIFLFLNGDEETAIFSSLAEEFQLKVIISESISDIMQLPVLYKTAREALELMLDDRYTAGNVRRVDELRLPLLLKKLENRTDLVTPELQKLAKHDKEKGTQFCETLYLYLCCNRSLAKTGDMLYTHRNTILYRIRKIQYDFGIPLDDDSSHTELLLGVSVLLFADRGAEFFMRGTGEGM